MNNLEEQKNRKAYFFTLIGVLTLIVAIIGTTYAFFQLTATNSNISGSAADVGLNLEITKIVPNTEGIDNLVPQYGSFINQSVNSKCSDNNNTVCQLYELKLINTGSTPITISGTIAFNGIENMPNLKWSTGTVSIDSIENIVTEISDANFSTPGNTASIDATTLGEPITIQAGENSATSVYLVVWIEETGELQYDTGTFTATVNYTSTEGQGITSTITS